MRGRVRKVEQAGLRGPVFIEPILPVRRPEDLVQRGALAGVECGMIVAQCPSSEHLAQLAA